MGRLIPRAASAPRPPRNEHNAMRFFEGSIPRTAALRRPKITLGMFDGVHRGHREVLRQLLAWARSTDSDALVVTFDRKPRDALAGRTSDLITSPRHRVRLFEQMGMDAALMLRFTRKLAATEPETFVKEFLVNRIGATGVLLGHDTRFGRNGRGNMPMMKSLGRELGFEACSVPVVELDGKPISSTRVRRAIRRGDLPAVERLLGRPFSLLGTVVRGTGRGEKIGFPTANLDLHREVQPPEGVYVTRALVNGVWLDSVTNVGRAPTLRPNGPPHRSETPIIETHLLDFSGRKLYGKEIEVLFVKFIRLEEVFESPEALGRRIAADVAEARVHLAAAAASRHKGKP